MNLAQTPESIVPEQSVIDSWPTKVRTTSNACQKQEPVEVIFDAERWLYERKNAYPMVAYSCINVPLILVPTIPLIPVLNVPLQRSTII